jgi:hypothetical protein
MRTRDNPPDLDRGNVNTAGRQGKPYRSGRRGRAFADSGRGNHDEIRSTNCCLSDCSCFRDAVSVRACGGAGGRGRRTAVLCAARWWRRRGDSAANLRLRRLSGVPAGGGRPARKLRAEHRLPWRSVDRAGSTGGATPALTQEWRRRTSGIRNRMASSRVP